MLKKIGSLGEKVTEKTSASAIFFLSQLGFLNFLIWQYIVRSEYIRAYQQKVVSKTKKLMNCLVTYIWNLLGEGRNKINNVLMKRKIESTHRKIESTYTSQQMVTVISLEHWKKYTEKNHRLFNLLYQFLVSIDLNEFLQLHMTVSFVKYSHHLLTFYLMYLLLK